VPCCTRVQHTLSVCNVGPCPLHVSHVGFRHKRKHYRLINNPFPATLHPGSCLGVVVQYAAKEKVARGAELEIRSDDPHEPVKHVEVLAYTVWDCCCGGDAGKCCGEAKCGCGKGCRRECCDEDDDEEGDEA